MLWEEEEPSCPGEEAVTKPITALLPGFPLKGNRKFGLLQEPVSSPPLQPLNTYLLAPSKYDAMPLEQGTLSHNLPVTLLQSVPSSL